MEVYTVWKDLFADPIIQRLYKLEGQQQLLALP